MTGYKPYFHSILKLERKKKTKETILFRFIRLY